MSEFFDGKQYIHADPGSLSQLHVQKLLAREGALGRPVGSVETARLAFKECHAQRLKVSFVLLASELPFDASDVDGDTSIDLLDIVDSAVQRGDPEASSIKETKFVIYTGSSGDISALFEHPRVVGAIRKGSGDFIDQLQQLLSNG